MAPQVFGDHLAVTGMYCGNLIQVQKSLNACDRFLRGPLNFDKCAKVRQVVEFHQASLQPPGFPVFFKQQYLLKPQYVQQRHNLIVGRERQIKRLSGTQAGVLARAFDREQGGGR